MRCPAWALALSIHLQWTWRPPKALRCLLGAGHARALLPPWQVRMGLPGTSWMGMARFVVFSVEQEAFSPLSLSLPKCCTPNSQHCWPGEVASTLLWWATEFGQHSGLTQNLLLGTGVSNSFSAFFRHFNHVILFPGFPIETCMVLK